MTKTLKTIPVFGLKKRGAGKKTDNPAPLTNLPAPRQTMAVEDIKNMLVNGGLETYGLLQEIKRLVRIGVIPLSPKNVAMLTKAEKDCSEVLLGQSTSNNNSSKSVVLQIIQSLEVPANNPKINTPQKINPTDVDLLESHTKNINPDVIINDTPDDVKLNKFKQSRGPLLVNDS